MAQMAMDKVKQRALYYLWMKSIHLGQLIGSNSPWKSGTVPEIVDFVPGPWKLYYISIDGPWRSARLQS